MEWLSDPQAWIGFVTLSVLEIVLGIDNVVFISILAGKLPSEQRARARRLGLGLAMAMRILMLLGISWIVRLTTPLFMIQVMDRVLSSRNTDTLINLFIIAAVAIATGALIVAATRVMQNRVGTWVERALLEPVHLIAQNHGPSDDRNHRS